MIRYGLLRYHRLTWIAEYKDTIVSQHSDLNTLKKIIPGKMRVILKVQKISIAYQEDESFKVEYQRNKKEND